LTERIAASSSSLFERDCAQAGLPMAAKRTPAWNQDAIRWSDWFGKLHATISAHDREAQGIARDIWVLCMKVDERFNRWRAGPK
jgi:hypothetical protein